MSQFSRRARWLNNFFPASVLPQSNDPGVVSDDVSLVQPYDGSGYGLAHPRQWFTRGDSTPAGTTGTVNMLTVPEDSIYRLFGASGFTIAGNSPVSGLFVIDLAIAPNLACQLAPQEQNAGGTGQFAFQINRAIVIAPGHTLQIGFFGGSASTLMRFSVYGVLAPIGTVFYC